MPFGFAFFRFQHGVWLHGDGFYDAMAFFLSFALHSSRACFSSLHGIISLRRFISLSWRIGWLRPRPRLARGLLNLGSGYGAGVLPTW
ncbi:uncharacterized protein BDR25DRAFT_90408 [Lindgomyces ingoldianus]|uniref:Uncharacterized protein n=1 Tax=Lindgomyces ingoldianus TaxID=673940 RepID=A0ACB6RAH3_9PLEO|nr:uncharacterized protein BDR25DRAFT_90408 [Lindgomyces ingoldianus]KAF2476087.1 hypothetical protein BDR25DRAFT_90408 [Lindgomyces ingoldianus]